MTQPTPLLQLDWQFFSVVVSIIALLVSLAPNIRMWFRRSHVEIDVPDKINITHKIGNPNVQLFISLRNKGGRTIRIKKLQVSLSRDDVQIAVLPGAQVYETPTSYQSVMMRPFDLAPDEEWAHAVVFFNDFKRKSDQSFRQAQSKINQDFQTHFNATRANMGGFQYPSLPVEANPATVMILMGLFNELFIWEPGEYKMTLSMQTQDPNSVYSEGYRFTLYESDSEDLKRHTQDYKFGVGITAPAPAHSVGLYIPMVRKDAE